MRRGDEVIPNLLNFPPELWASIAQWLEGEHIGRLLMTGSKWLWARLSVPHTIKAIKLGKDHFHLKRWPAFLNELITLEELAIQCYSMPWWQSWAPKLCQAPKTLRKLSLKGPSKCLASFFVGHDKRVLWLDEYMPSIEYLSFELDWTLRNEWMGRMPSTLTSLTFHTYDGSLALPKTLTELTIGSLDYLEMLVFPPQLQSLSLGQLNGDFSLQALLPLLPHSLQDFQVTESSQECFRVDHLIQLPSALTRLNLSRSSNCERSATSPTHLLMPSCLTSVSVMNMPGEYWHCMPPTLQSLHINFDSFLEPDGLVASISKLSHNNYPRWRHFKWLPIQNLSRTLKTLKLESQTPIFLDIPADSLVPEKLKLTSIFPPDLTCFSARDCQISHSVASQLPPSLTHLGLHYLTHDICKILPRGIRELDVHSVAMSPDLMFSLPPALISFSCPPHGDYHLRWFNATHEAFEPLPEALWSTTKEERFDGALPSALRSLSLLNTCGMDDRLADSRFYPRLTSLTMNVARNNMIPFLPTSLTLLNILKAHFITGRCFSHLPRGLVVLRLDECQEIEDEDIQHLPPSLLSCSVSPAPNLSNACIKYLPRQLEYLWLYSSPAITKACIPDLPFKAHSISTPYSAFRFSSFSVVAGEAK